MGVGSVILTEMANRKFQDLVPPRRPACCLVVLLQGADLSNIGLSYCLPDIPVG